MTKIPESFVRKGGVGETPTGNVLAFLGVFYSTVSVGGLYTSNSRKVVPGLL